jgi:hypothetical protein
METTLNQDVKREIKAQNKFNETRVSPNVVAAAKAAAKTTTIKPKDAKTEKAETKKPEVKKEPKVRAESNEAIGQRLLKEKANEATILATFTEVYKTKSNITDEKFIKARAAIYMKIAAKKAEAAKSAKKAS